MAADTSPLLPPAHDMPAGGGERRPPPEAEPPPQEPPPPEAPRSPPAPGLRRFWSRPELAQDWDEEQGERSADWTELFFDLFLVAAVSAVVTPFVDDPSLAGAGRFALYLGLFHFTWASHIHLTTRVHLGALAFDALRFLRHAGVLGMALAAQDFGSYARLFAGSYLVVRAVSFAQFLIIALTLPRAAAFARVSAGLHVLMASLAVVDLAAAPAFGWDAEAAHAGLFGAILFLEAAAPAAVTAVPAAHLPLHVEHVDERLGLVQLIYLGESIVALGTSHLAPGTPALQVLGVGRAAAVVWSLFMTIYHVEADQHAHALRQGKLRGLAFQYIHALLGLALNTSGAGLLLLLKTYRGEEKAQQGTIAGAGPGGGGAFEERSAWVLCAGYGAALHLTAALRATNYFPIAHGRRAAMAATKLLPEGEGGDEGGARKGESGGAAERVTGRLKAWWAFAVLWPALAYIMPLAARVPGRAGRLSTTSLLACVAAHALIYVVVETGISSTLAAEAEVEGEADGRDGRDTPAGPEPGGGREHDGGGGGASGGGEGESDRRGQEGIV